MSAGKHPFPPRWLVVTNTSRWSPCWPPSMQYQSHGFLWQAVQVDVDLLHSSTPHPSYAAPTTLSPAMWQPMDPLCALKLGKKNSCHIVCIISCMYKYIYIYIYMIYNDVYKSRSIYMYIGYRLYVELSILIYHLWISLCIPHVFQYKFRPALPQCVQGLIATKVQMAWPRNQLLVVTSFYCREYFGMQGRPQQILDSQTLLYSTTDGSYSPYNCSIESRWKHSH